jgi:hypothetical protein
MRRNYYDDHLEITSAPIIVVTTTRGNIFNTFIQKRLGEEEEVK